MELVAQLLRCELVLGKQLATKTALQQQARAAQKERDMAKKATGHDIPKKKKKSAAPGEEEEDEALSGMDKATEAMLYQTCGKNSAWRALLSIQMSRLHDDSERKIACLEQCELELNAAMGAETELRKELSRRPNKQPTLVPPMPIFVSRSATSITLRIDTFIPRKAKGQNSWEVKNNNLDVAHFCVYCKPEGSGTDVSLNNTEYPGTGTPVPMEQSIVQVKGLTPNQSYVFAVAAYDGNGELVGDGIGKTTAGIQAILPMPMLLCWGRLCEAARGVSTPVARKAAQMLFNHFVLIKKPRPLWEANPMCEFVLKRDWLRISSLPLLRSLTLALHTLAETDGSGSKLVDDIKMGGVPLLNAPVGLLQTLGKLLLAVDVAVAIDDAPLIQESIVRTYNMLLPLLRLKQRGHWLLPALAISYQAGRVLKTMDDNTKEVLLCISFELFGAMREKGETASVEELLTDVPSLPRGPAERAALLDFLRALPDEACKRLELPPEPKQVLKRPKPGLRPQTPALHIANSKEDEYNDALSATVWAKLHAHPATAFDWMKTKGFMRDPTYLKHVARICLDALKQDGFEAKVRDWLEAVKPPKMPEPLTKMVLFDELVPEEQTRVRAAEAKKREQERERRRAKAEAERLRAEEEALEAAAALEEANGGKGKDKKKSKEEKKTEEAPKEGEPEEGAEGEPIDPDALEQLLEEEEEEEYEEEQLELRRYPEREEEFQLLWLSFIELLRGLGFYKLFAKRVAFKRCGPGPAFDLAEALQQGALEPYERPDNQCVPDGSVAAAAEAATPAPAPVSARSEASNTARTVDEEEEEDSGDEPAAVVVKAKAAAVELNLDKLLAQCFAHLSFAAVRARWAHAWQHLQICCRYMWNGLWFGWVSPRDFGLVEVTDLDSAVFDWKDWHKACTALLDMLTLRGNYASDGTAAADDDDGDDDGKSAHRALTATVTGTQRDDDGVSSVTSRASQDSRRQGRDAMEGWTLSSSASS